MPIAINITDPSGRVNPDIVRKGDLIVVEDQRERRGFRLANRKQIKFVKNLLAGKSEAFIVSVFRSLDAPLLPTENRVARNALLTMCSRVAAGDLLLDERLSDAYRESLIAWITAQKLGAALGLSPGGDMIETEPVEDRVMNTWQA